MTKLYEHTYPELLTWMIKGRPKEHGFNGKNFFCEWDDDSLGYGGKSVINQLYKNNGRWSIIRGTSGGSCTDERFRTKFIDKNIENSERHRDESIGDAEQGGSISTYKFCCHNEIGYVTPTREYRIVKFEYILKDGSDVTLATAKEFSKKLQEIKVVVYDVTADEYTKSHGLGKTYNGWYNKSFLFDSLPFKIDFYGIVEFSSIRYSFRVGKKLKYELHKDGEITSLPTIRYHYPCNSGNKIQHYSDMDQVSDENSEDLHTIKCGSDVFEGEFYTYETIRASETDKMVLCETQAGGKHNIHPIHLHELDKPTVDIISADGTYVTNVYLFPNKTIWPAEYNNRKWFFVLSPDSEIPFARMKTEFSIDEFPIQIRSYVKKLAKSNNLLHETSNVRLKKDEDAEIQNYIKILKDDEHPAHSTVLLNTGKVLNETPNSNFLIRECTEYTFRTDLVIGDTTKHLQEWQKLQMDDEHLMEIIGRIVDPKHDFKTITWVHGGISDDITNKLKLILSGNRVNLTGIEKIQLIHKRDLYMDAGWKNIVEVYKK